MMNATFKVLVKRSACEVLFWGSVAYLIYITATLLSFFVHDHSDFVSFFTRRYPDAWRIDEYGSKFFTEAHYRFVRSFAPFLVPILLATTVGMLWKRRVVADWITGLFSDFSWLAWIIKENISGLTSSRFWIFITSIVCLLTLNVYMFVVLSPYGDEHFNLTNFASKGMFHSSVYSNTHMLSNILSAFWLQVGFGPELSLSITSILSAIVIYLILFSVVSHYFNFRTGLVAMVVTGVTLWFNLYSVQGVGYRLMCLFALIAMVAMTGIIQRKQGYHLFVIACVLGLCASRLFVIPLISFLLIYVFIVRDAGILKQFFGIAIIATLLYLPMYLWSGGLLFFFREIDSHDLVRMSPVLLESFSLITEVNSNSYYVVIALAILAMVFFKKCDPRIQFLIVLGVSTFASILIFSFAAMVYPPSRVFVYANFFFYAIVAIIFTRLVKENIAVLCFFIALKIAASVYLWNYGWQAELGLR